MLHICEKGYQNLIVAYLRQMVIDYRYAMAHNNIKEMVQIEKDIEADTFFGDVCGITSGMMLRQLRYEGYDKNKFEIKRDPVTRYPIDIIIKEDKRGKNRRRKAEETEGAGEEYLLDI